MTYFSRFTNKRSHARYAHYSANFAFRFYLRRVRGSCSSPLSRKSIKLRNNRGVLPLMARKNVGRNLPALFDFNSMSRFLRKKRERGRGRGRAENGSRNFPASSVAAVSKKTMAHTDVQFAIRDVAHSPLCVANRTSDWLASSSPRVDPAYIYIPIPRSPFTRLYYEGRDAFLISTFPARSFDLSNCDSFIRGAVRFTMS